MTNSEDAPLDIDRHIIELKKEGLVQAAAAAERLRAAATGRAPLGDMEMLAIFAENLEEIERRLVAVESREV